jgi:hypothetical protein
MSDQGIDREQAVREAAYSIWEREGRPDGHAEDHWRQALAEMAREGHREGESAMNRIKVLDEASWPKVPKNVIHQAEQAAQSEPSWIAMQGNGHVVLVDPPGSPDVATGDLILIAEVAPVRSSNP